MKTLLVMGALAVVLVSGAVLVGMWASRTQELVGPRRVAEHPQVVASLGGFAEEGRNFHFTVTVESAEDTVVRVVVYARNDMLSPPMRGAWPNPAALFRAAGTERGKLTPAGVRAGWGERPAEAKGHLVVVKADDPVEVQGAIGMPRVSPLQAWQGKPVDVRGRYQEAMLWVFGEDGRLLVAHTYALNR